MRQKRRVADGFLQLKVSPCVRAREVPRPPHTLEPEELRPKRACSRRPAKVADEKDSSTETLRDYATQTGVASTETRFFYYSEIQFLFSDGNVNVESMGEQQRPRGLFQQRSFRLLSASILRPGKARPGPGFLGVASRCVVTGNVPLFGCCSRTFNPSKEWVPSRDLPESDPRRPAVRDCHHDGQFFHWGRHPG